MLLGKQQVLGKDSYNLLKIRRIKMNVNFEVTEINRDRGTVMVKFWADGATIERFGAEMGPYEIRMLPECAIMSPLEFDEHIAAWGQGIVANQYAALESDTQGVATMYENAIGVPTLVDLVIV